MTKDDDGKMVMNGVGRFIYISTSYVLDQNSEPDVDDFYIHEGQFVDDVACGAGKRIDCKE